MASWASLSMVKKLEICQMYAGCAITGQVKMTPAEAILAEADFPTIATKATQLCTIAMEKSLRMPDMNPIRQLVRTKVGLRTNATS